jgi:hypothetical protein
MAESDYRLTIIDNLTVVTIIWLPRRSYNRAQPPKREKVRSNIKSPTSQHHHEKLGFFIAPEMRPL